MNIDIVTEWDYLAGSRFHLRIPDIPVLEVSISNICQHRGDAPLQITLQSEGTYGIYCFKYAPLRRANIAHINEGNQRDSFEDIVQPDDKFVKKGTEYLFDVLERRKRCLGINVLQ